MTEVPDGWYFVCPVDDCGYKYLRTLPTVVVREGRLTLDSAAAQKAMYKDATVMTDHMDRHGWLDYVTTIRRLKDELGEP